MQAEMKEPGVDFRRIWRARPSRREGFNKTYAGLFPDGSTIELDYNFAREMVRIEYRPADEAERLYIAVVKHGVVLRERDFATNRVVDMQRRIRPLAPFFQYFPDNHVLRSLGGIYGLPRESRLPSATSTGELFRRSLRTDERRRLLRQQVHHLIRKRRAAERRQRPFFGRILHRLPGDLFDLSLAGIPLFLFFQKDVAPGGLALMLSALGFFTGAVDLLWRQRNPLIVKTLAFLVPAGSVIWLKFQLEEWAIFEPVSDFILQRLAILLAGSHLITPG